MGCHHLGTWSSPWPLRSHPPIGTTERGQRHERALRRAGTMTRVTEPLAPHDQLRRRIEALPRLRQAAFALACAEHLVGVEASPRQTELRAAIAQGFEQLAGEPRDLAALREALSSREDVDQDEVAAVVFGLGAVMGLPDSAWLTAGRALDAAYERVPYPADAMTFRPVEQDTADPAVQQEFLWHDWAVKSLESDQDLSEIVASLRS